MNREGSNTPSGCLYHTPAKYETKLVLQFGMEGVKAIGFPWLQFGIEGVEAIGWLDAWFQHQLGSTDADSDWMPALAIGPGWTDAKEAPEPGSRDAEVFRVSAESGPRIALVDRVGTCVVAEIAMHMLQSDQPNTSSLWPGYTYAVIQTKLTCMNSARPAGAWLLETSQAG